MKSTGKDEVVVGAQLVQAPLVEGLVVDQAAGLVDYYEAKNSPIFELAMLHS